MEINILETKMTENKLISKIQVPQELEKYMKTNTLFIEYDTTINTDESILNIPIISTLLPLA